MIDKAKQNYEEILEFVFKISYLCMAFATFITYIYMSPIQPILVKLTLVLGTLTILARVINWKKYRKMPCLLLMLLFCLSFLLSTVMNRQYGMTDNLKWIIWTAIQFFGLYMCDLERDEKKYQREFVILSHIFIIITIFAAAASLIMLIMSYSAILTSVDGEFIVTGFEWDRLWGAYVDPNYGAICSVIGIVLSLFYVIKKKGFQKILYVLAVVLNYAYLIFSDSRTGEIALAVSLGIFLFFLGKNKFKSKKCLKSIFMLIGVLVVLLSISQEIKTQNITYQKSVVAAREAAAQEENKRKEEQSTAVTGEQNSEVTGEQNSKVAGEQSGEPTEEQNSELAGKQKNEPTQRQKDLREDVSNGRLALWQSAVEVWETSPIYGAGYSTFIAYAKENAPDTFAVNNDVGEYTSMHNTFFSALAYQGGIGAVLLLVIALRIFFSIIKVVKSENNERQLEVVVMFSCVCGIAVSMMFLLDGIYTNSISAAILWIFSGYLVRESYWKSIVEK